MAAEGVSNGFSVQFEFAFLSILGQQERLVSTITIPFTDDVPELAQHIISEHRADPIVKNMDIFSGE